MRPAAIGTLGYVAAFVSRRGRLFGPVWLGSVTAQFSNAFWPNYALRPTSDTAIHVALSSLPHWLPVHAVYRPGSV